MVDAISRTRGAIDFSKDALVEKAKAQQTIIDGRDETLKGLNAERAAVAANIAANSGKKGYDPTNDQRRLLELDQKIGEVSKDRDQLKTELHAYVENVTRTTNEDISPLKRDIRRGNPTEPDKPLQAVLEDRADQATQNA